MNVAPLAGAWIEMLLRRRQANFAESHPSRVRGLKFQAACRAHLFVFVAPLAGAWIEMR